MRISMEKALISASVGAIDLAGEEFLKDKMIGPLNGDDALRIGLTVGSFLVNYLGYETDISETVFYSSLPLMIKAIRNVVRGAQAESKRVVIIQSERPKPAPVVVETPPATKPTVPP